MKFLCISAILATSPLSTKCFAFTFPESPMQSSSRCELSATSLLSSLVKDSEKMASQSKQLQFTDEKELQGYISQTSTNEEVNRQRSYLDDGFVFGLNGSGLERPKGKDANIVVEGDSLETTPQQVGIVSATFAGHAFFAANAIHNLLLQMDGNVELTAMTSIATVIASWILADFGSGVFHWSVDNYGNGRTPVMGNIIAAFQGHHSAPWTITYRGFCNNVWKLCIPFGVPTVAAITLIAGPENPTISLFFAIFCAIEILSQELHKWSHMTKSEVPSWVNTLQDLGVSIGRVPHAQHHLAPYDGNYCIVSGLCNETLDRSGFFRWMEHRVYELNGVESNAWKLDPKLRERTLRGNYRLLE
ncbi:hypothetical protein ACHAW5_010235 [Stephanodiscus triporus]|uniref:Lipid desaturase domain-containing protein n=1 Tax=Stephanodiscus triporus TaxID=2934178 RepID=A0ABD3NR83_9STRA